MRTDAIDLSTVTLLSSPDVRSWPATTEITRIDVVPTNVTFQFTKKDGPDRWPDQLIGETGGPLQYTVWLFLQIAGAWYGAGFIQMWHDRDGVGDSITGFPADWYYDASRWGPMVGHAIQPGELIGFMVTAGDARGDKPQAIRERSNVVTIKAPTQDTGVFDLIVEPAPAPAPAPPTPPADPFDLDDLFSKFADLLQAVVSNTEAVVAQTQRLDTLIQHGVKVHL